MGMFMVKPDKLTNIHSFLDNDKTLWAVGPMEYFFDFSGNTITKVIFVDGGDKHKPLFPEIGSITIGDGDSSKVVPDLFKAKQTQSDLSFLLENLPTTIEKIHLLGFLGGRRDHELLNLGAAFHLGQSRQCIIHFDHNVSVYPAGQFSIDYEGIFSLLSFEDMNCEIFGQVDYPLKKTCLSKVSCLGLSNVAKGNFTISCDQSFLIFFNE